MASRILSRDFYADAPEFGTEVLHPSLDAGMDLYLVGGFIPSYAISLSTLLSRTERVEPGELNIVLGIPFAQMKSDKLAESFAFFLNTQIDDIQTAEDFVGSMIHLMNEGSGNLTLLLTPPGAGIANGCIGLLTSNGTDAESIVFSDALQGDNNSPIFPKSSANINGSAEKAEFQELTETIEKAIFDVMPGISRISKNEALDVLKELLAKKWLNKAFGLSSSGNIKEAKRSSAKKSKEDVRDWFENQDPGALLAAVNRGLLETDLTEKEFLIQFFGKRKYKTFYKFFGLAGVESDEFF